MTDAISKVVLITGSAARVGAAIARQLHASGMRVIIHYRHSQKEAQKLVEAFNQERPDSARLIHFDLNEISEFSNLLPTILSFWGRLDGLIHNASGFYRTTFGQIQESQWDDLIRSNLKGAFFLSQALASALRESQGQVVCIADIHGERPLRDYCVYGIAKAGLLMMTKSLAKELAPEVRVNAISPGAVCWPTGENTLDAAMQEKILRQIPLHKQGKPEDIAQAVQFVMSSTYMTGEVIHIDGGRSI